MFGTQAFVLSPLASMNVFWTWLLVTGAGSSEVSVNFSEVIRTSRTLTTLQVE